MTLYVVVQPKSKRVDVFQKKIDAVYFHAGDNYQGGSKGFKRNEHVVLKEITSRRQLPKGYKVFEW